MAELRMLKRVPQTRSDAMVDVLLNVSCATPYLVVCCKSTLQPCVFGILYVTTLLLYDLHNHWQLYCGSFRWFVRSGALMVKLALIVHVHSCRQYLKNLKVVSI